MTFASTASGSTIRHAHATAHTVGACRRPRCKSAFNLGNLVSHYAPLDFTVTVRHVSGSGIGLLQDNSACHISPCMRSGRIIMWDGRTTSTSSYTTGAPQPVRSHSDIDRLYSKFMASLSRRSESRASVAAQHALSTSPTGSIRSLPTTYGSSTSPSSYSHHSRRREVPLVKPGAEGKLLVPNVTMRRTSSCLSSCAESFSGAPKMRHSPASRQGSDLSAEESVAEEHEDVTMRLQSLPTTQQQRGEGA